MNIIDEQINLTLKNFIFENMTNEANNNLPIHEFDNDMKKLGFIKDYDRAGSRVIYKLKDGGLKITTHYPGKTAKADMLRNVFDNLIKIKWFDNPDNFNIFPFDRWGFNPNSINIDTTKQDILKANEIYQNAEVYRVFYNTPNKLCVLHTNEGYNLCRDINDKRPLLDKWYNGFEQGNVPKLKLDNYETMETEVYPINQDGTLDTKNITLENKKLNIMTKKVIRLTETDLHRIIKESVNKILKEEYGNSHRSQYMLGRLANRQSERGERPTANDRAYTMYNNDYSDDYRQGFDDEAKYGRNSDSTWDGNKYRNIQFNYDTKKMQDMDELKGNFIDFIEKYRGGVLLQTIVDYESGNETGKPQSPLGEIIPYFEEEVLGFECTPEMKNAIKSAYRQWWFYAQDQLMSNE